VLAAVEEAAGGFLADADQYFIPVVAHARWRKRVAVPVAIARIVVARQVRVVGSPLAPVLEEERHAGHLALIAQRSRPIGMHGTSVGTALTAIDDPTDTGMREPAADHSKIDRPNVGNGGVLRCASPLW
jgi:hypothetical protein